MKKNRIEERDPKKLENMLEREREKLRRFRFKISQGKVKNVKEGKHAKRVIARILTRLNI